MRKKVRKIALNIGICIVSSVLFNPIGNAIAVEEGAEKSEWSSFMGNQTNTGISTEELIPPLTLKWKFKAGGSIYSSPVVADGRVFFGSDDKKVYALSVESGETIWSYETKGEVIAPPLVDGGVVYIGSKGGHMYALSADKGRPLWKYNAREKITNGAVSDEKNIYFSSKNKIIIAVDKKKGKRVYRRTLPKYDLFSYYGTPAYYDGSVYMTTTKNEVVKYSAEKGARKWVYSVISSIYSSPVIKDEIMYTTSYDRFIYAADISGKTPKNLWRTPLGSWIYATPTVTEEGIYVGTKAGDLYALSPSDGTELWRFEMETPINSSMVVVANNTGFVGTDSGVLHAIDLEEGVSVWSFTSSASIHTSPAILGGMLFFGSTDGSFYALETKEEE